MFNWMFFSWSLSHVCVVHLVDLSHRPCVWLGLDLNVAFCFVLLLQETSKRVPGPTADPSPMEAATDVRERARDPIRLENRTDAPVTRRPTRRISTGEHSLSLYGQTSTRLLDHDAANQRKPRKSLRSANDPASQSFHSCTNARPDRSSLETNGMRCTINERTSQQPALPRNREMVDFVLFRPILCRSNRLPRIGLDCFGGVVVLFRCRKERASFKVVPTGVCECVYACVYAFHSEIQNG